MVKKGGIFLILFIGLFLLSGCATARKQKDLEIQGLKNQILVLETELNSKDQEITQLKEALDKTSEEETATKNKGRVIAEVKSRPSIKNIQTALKNAGYDPGLIDGRMGRQTKDAIKAFQRANNLAVDGKVGKETWGLLKGYLYKKVK